MKIRKEKLLAEDLPNSAIENQIIEVDRWGILHRIVFAFEGKHYRANYRIGATEYQDETPWQYDQEVECEEVRKVSRMVEVWEPVPREG